MAPPHATSSSSNSSTAKKDSVDAEVQLKNELTEPAFQEKLRNPHIRKSREQIITEATELAEQKGLNDDKDVIVRGALLAWDPNQKDHLDLDEYERECLRKEFSTNWKEKWSQTKMMYYVAC